MSDTHELYEISIQVEREKWKARIEELNKNLGRLQNQDGGYANAHRKLIAVYENIYGILVDA